MADDYYPNPNLPDFEAIRKLVGGSGPWVLMALVVAVAALFYSVRVAKVTGEQVGVKLNKITGKTKVVTQSGTVIYNGITNEFFVLDKTVQTLEMTEVQGQGDRAGKDDLKIKTVDGSDVFVDLKVQYRMVRGSADTVLETSGPGDQYKRKWARDYVRSLVRNHLGALTTEEFYDATLRDERLADAKEEVNEKFKDFGIRIETIGIPREPHFYAEYEEMIKNKKLADQAVLTEQSKALAAKQLRETMIVEQTNKMNVEIEEFSGRMEQKTIVAQAEAEKAREAAEAYHERITIGAGATLYEMGKKAQGILAQRQKEAQGLKELMAALEGPGGRNMVKLEYAKRLKDVVIQGQPITLGAEASRFQHLYAPAAKDEKLARPRLRTRK